MGESSRPSILRIQRRAIPREPLSTRIMRRVETLFEWIAAYPPYTLGREESSLLFDEYRALNVAHPDSVRRRNPAR